MSLSKPPKPVLSKISAEIAATIEGEPVVFVRAPTAGEPTDHLPDSFWPALTRARAELDTDHPRRLMLERIADGDLPVSEYQEW